MDQNGATRCRVVAAYIEEAGLKLLQLSINVRVRRLLLCCHGNRTTVNLESHIYILDITTHIVERREHALEVIFLYNSLLKINLPLFILESP